MLPPHPPPLSLRRIVNVRVLWASRFGPQRKYAPAVTFDYAQVIGYLGLQLPERSKKDPSQEGLWEQEID
jgi:hypothetical protein